MKAEKVKAVLKYLRSIPKPENWEGLQIITDKLIKLGAKFINSGCYSSIYEVNGFCLKLSLKEPFDKLRTFRTNSIFKRFAPTIYWIHDAGFALLCKLVTVITNSTNFRLVARRIDKLLRKHGFKTFDFHEQNLVKTSKTQWMLVDYGCWGIAR